MVETISVIVPTHDRPESLRRLVRCVLAQSRRADELLLVNDGAEGIDPVLLREIESAGLPVKELRRSQASSAAGRNAGLEAAGGDIIVCLDDDMTPAPDFLEALAALYALDDGGVVGGIGAAYEESGRTWTWRLWEAAFAVLGRVRWAPRYVAARYVHLPFSLAGRLEPASMIPAGALSLRRGVARWARFDESMTGYAFGEDREFTFRVGRRAALFCAKGLRVGHAAAEGGRGDWRQRGRVYVENVLFIVRRSVDGGAGTRLMVAVDFVGAIAQYALWGLAPGGGHNRAFAAGMIEALARRTMQAMRAILCGC